MFNPDVPTVMMERPNPISENLRILWCAVIEQAVDDLRGCNDEADKDSGHQKRLRKNAARRWFNSESTYPNSFLSVCELLQLDPSQIRKKLLAEKKTLQIERRNLWN